MYRQNSGCSGLPCAAEGHRRSLTSWGQSACTGTQTAPADTAPGCCDRSSRTRRDKKQVRRAASPTHTCNLKQASANREHITTPAGAICSMQPNSCRGEGAPLSNSQPTPAMGHPWQMAQMLQCSSNCVLVLPFNFPALTTHRVAARMGILHDTQTH